ncbi:MAG: hypothetical protein IJM63_10195 [Solobacterium sp.]|nr:hypothetical protein [Solobacterium sp.]
MKSFRKIICLSAAVMLTACSTPAEQEQTPDASSATGRDALKSVTANTYVGEYGQYVESFTFTFEDGYDASKLSSSDFTVSETAKHPSAGHASFGVYDVTADGSAVTVSVDPFLYNDTYTAAAVIDGDTVSFAKADVNEMKVAVVDDFEALTTDQGMAYRLYVPESEAPLPLVVTFHGNGEQGTDNYLQMVNNRVTTKWGEPESQALYKCIVLGPQASQGWSDEELADVRGIIDQLIADGKADANRIYAAGLAGFEATIRFAAANTDLLAGVLAMIYWKDFDPDLSTLTDLPIWMTIAENDFTGEAPHIVETYEYLTNELGNKNVRYTLFTDDEMASYGLYGGLTHWGWIPTLNNPEMVDWLFSQHR